ncbi:hypothetical protein LV779_34825 [Streptomyces thinghirensis]|nr:hypothetical protein [Streptomyces thinghirensis]
MAGLPTALVATHSSGNLVIAPCAPSTTRCPASATPAGTSSTGRQPRARPHALAVVADTVGIAVKLVGTPAED